MMSFIGLVGLVIALVSIVVSIVLLALTAYRQTQKLNASKAVRRSIADDDVDYVSVAAHATVFITTVALTICCALLVYCFLTGNTQIEYVVQYHSDSGSPLFKLAGLWGGRQGSLLFWAWLISLFNLVIGIRSIRSGERIDTVALAILQAVLVAFVGVLLFSTDNMPFVSMDPMYFDAQGNLTGVAKLWGMNALLEHWAMAIHPPTLFVGYAGLTVPFAYAIAALTINDPSKLWVRRCERFALFSWLFLGIGIGLGAVWAYVVLGWGGYWGWDPVENASLLSWLVCVALIHSFTVYRQRGIFKRWAVMCACLAFAFVIVGTFISRSGIVQSVHAFEGDPVSLALFLSLIVASVLLGAGGLALRWKSFASDHADGDQSDSFMTKDVAYYFNNFIMVFLTVLLMYMTISSALPAFLPFGGHSLGAGTYNAIARPLGIIYCLLMAVCPLLAWGKTDPRMFLRKARIPAIFALALFIILMVYFVTRLLPVYTQTLNDGGTAAQTLMEAGPALYYNGLAIVGFLAASLLSFNSLFMLGRLFKGLGRGGSGNAGGSLAKRVLRNSSTIGGFLSHVSMAVILVGLIGSSMYVTSHSGYLPYDPETEVATEDYSIGDYRLVNTDSTITVGDNQDDVYYALHFDVYHGDTYIGSIDPNVQQIQSTQQQKLNAGVVGSPLEDLFVVYKGVNGEGAFSMDIKINPLISFVWIGFALLMVGTAISAFGMRRKLAAQTVPETVPETVSDKDAVSADGVAGKTEAADGAVSGAKPLEEGRQGQGHGQDADTSS